MVWLGAIFETADTLYQLCKPDAFGTDSTLDERPTSWQALRMIDGESLDLYRSYEGLCEVKSKFPICTFLKKLSASILQTAFAP